MRDLSRRSFLAATGLGAAMIPLMPNLGRTQNGAGIRRVITIAVPNGHTDKFIPSGGESDWSFNGDADSPLSPLTRHREKIIVMGGLILKNGWDTTHVVANNDPRGFGPGSIGGHAAPPVLLTGAVGADGPPQFDGWEMTAGGPSIDSYIADNLPGGENLKFKPLALRATRRNSASSYISFKGAPVTHKVQNTTGVYDDPIKLFGDMFGDGSSSDDELAAIVAGRKHILDNTTAHLKTMKSQFGTENQLRIEAHLEAVRQATEGVSIVANCQTPPSPDSDLDWVSANHNQNYPQIIKTQIDMTVVAMACDLTRSASLLWSDGANDDVSFRWLKDKDAGFEGTAPGGQLGGGQIRSHHNIAHHNNGALKNYSDQWFIEQYSYLLDRLAETLDADGRPMIETTVVLFTNMQRSGGGHQTEDLFWILGGNHDNYFKTGRFLRWAGGKEGESIPQNRILTALINSSGCPEVDYFGDPQYGGELARLRG